MAGTVPVDVTAGWLPEGGADDAAGVVADGSGFGDAAACGCGRAAAGDADVAPAGGAEGAAAGAACVAGTDVRGAAFAGRAGDVVLRGSTRAGSEK